MDTVISHQDVPSGLKNPQPSTPTPVSPLPQLLGVLPAMVMMVGSQHPLGTAYRSGLPTSSVALLNLLGGVE